MFVAPAPTGTSIAYWYPRASYWLLSVGLGL